MKPFVHLSLATLSPCRLHFCSSEISHSMTGPILLPYRILETQDSGGQFCIGVNLPVDAIHTCSSDDHGLFSGPRLNICTLSRAVLISAGCGALEAGSLELSGHQIGPGLSSSVPVLSYWDCSQEGNPWSDEHSSAPSPLSSCQS